MGRRGTRKKKTRTSLTVAERADPHALYQQSVQCVEAEIDFVDYTFLARRGRQAKRLREDFCGTANTSASASPDEGADASTQCVVPKSIPTK